MSVLADWLARQPVPQRCSAPARRALALIRRCRTPEMGGRVYRCADCTRFDFAYHSCHHRACPRCGGNRASAWTARQEARLLPVPYFLVTFTVPEELRSLFSAQPAIMHDLFFRESAATLQEVAAQPRLLGAQLGFVGVLHTWGRQLQLHPHIHYIVPGGGLTPDGQRWKPSRQPDWLLPVAKLAAVFARRLSEAVRDAFPGMHASLPAGTWRRRWSVHSQPAGSGQAVVRYLARYVTRTAISDERIIEAHKDSVTFRFTDSANGQRRICTLRAEEFLRRYLQHVLPSGQHRVRSFGWLHPSANYRRLQVETLLSKLIIVAATATAIPPKAWHQHCPHCHGFGLVFIGTLPRRPSPKIEPLGPGPPRAFLA